MTEGSTIWVLITLLAYLGSSQLYRLSGHHPLLLPAFVGSAVVISILSLTGTDHAHYLVAVDPLEFWLGPATVALAVPLYGQWRRLMSLWRPVLMALLVGSLVAGGSALLVAAVFKGSPGLMVALAPKSTTMPVATALCRHFGGAAPIAALAVALTGTFGAVLFDLVRRFFRVPLNDEVTGFTLGLGAHAIGTARAVRISEVAGAFAALAMGLNGLMTALWMPLLGWVLGW